MNVPAVSRSETDAWRSLLPVLAIGLLALAVRLILAPYSRVFKADEFAYWLKAREILSGDWTPIETHAIGWSIVLAGVIGPWQHLGFQAQTVLVRVFSAILGAACVVPLHLIAREVLDRRAERVLLVLFAFSIFPSVSATSGMTEAPFSLLLVAALAAAVRAARRPGAVWWVGVWAGLSCWVRLNGVFVFGAALLILVWEQWRHRAFRLPPLAAAVAAFLVVASPVAVQRAMTFGSPAHFGVNSRYFVDGPAQMFSANGSIPTLGAYLATHQIGEIVSRFLVGGTLLTVWDLIWYGVSVPLLPLFAYGCWRRCRDRAIVPVVAIVAAWIVGMTPVYGLWRADRYLWPIFPILLIPLAAGLTDLSRRWPDRRHLLSTAVVILSAAWFAVSLDYRRQAVAEPFADGVVWGRWVAEHARGVVVVCRESSFIMMHLADARVGGAGMWDMRAPVTGLRTMNGGDFESWREAARWYRQVGATYLVLDEHMLRERPYMAAIAPDAPPPPLVLVYSNAGTSSRWPVRVYRFDWSR